MAAGGFRDRLAEELYSVPILRSSVHLALTLTLNHAKQPQQGPTVSH
jgi:hypothetical protein